MRIVKPLSGMDCHKGYTYKVKIYQQLGRWYAVLERIKEVKTSSGFMSREEAIKEGHRLLDSKAFNTCEEYI